MERLYLKDILNDKMLLGIQGEVNSISSNSLNEGLNNINTDA